MPHQSQSLPQIRTSISSATVRNESTGACCDNASRAALRGGLGCFVLAIRDFRAPFRPAIQGTDALTTIVSGGCGLPEGYTNTKPLCGLAMVISQQPAESL